MFWGGTGKSAAFLNSYGIDADRFPIVVDSDPNKIGYFVPGTGQEIRSPEYLLTKPLDSIVITTQWRARDIVAEIKGRNITYKKIYVVCDGRLINYEDSPYAMKTKCSA